VRADLHAARSAHLLGGTAVSGTGMVGIAGLVALLGPVGLVAAPVAVVAGVAVTRRHRRRARLVEAELERLLDQVACGERARAPLGRVAERLGGLRRPTAGKMTRR
jgi:Flp pilus assembly protein TadB